MTDQQPPTQPQTIRRAAVATREDPKSVAVTKGYQHQFAEVLPDHIEAKGFVGAALATLRKDPDLLKAAENSPTALVNTLMQCAQLGHTPGSKEFALTRRYNGKTKREEVVGLEQYQGVIERMYRSGAVASVIVREVCKGDTFDFVEGVHDRPVHDVDWFDGGVNRDDPESIIGVYAYARLTTGATSRVVVLSKQDIEKARMNSDMGKNNKGPWHDHYCAMAWKTAAHRLEPWVPTSAEYRREQLRASAAAARVDTSTGELLDGDVVDADVVDQ
jgi:recombination protein RecT